MYRNSCGWQLEDIYISVIQLFIVHINAHTLYNTHCTHTQTNWIYSKVFFVNFVKENNTGMSFAKENMIFLHDHLILSCYILLYLIGLSIQGLYLLLSFSRPYNLIFLLNYLLSNLIFYGCKTIYFTFILKMHMLCTLWIMKAISSIGFQR